MVTKEFLQDQIRHMKQKEKRFVAALTPHEIGYWMRRHNLNLGAHASKQLQAGWHQADREIANARRLAQYKSAHG